jgi:hypothetical protein
MSKPSYIKNTHTSTNYSTVEDNPKDSLTKGVILAYKHPKKGYFKAEQEREEERDRNKMVKTMDMQGALDEFKRKEKQAKIDNFRNKQKTRASRKKTLIEASKRTATLAKGIRTKRKIKSRKTRKYRRKTHRRR